MNEIKKAKQVRLYLNSENETLLRELCESLIDLPESQVMTMLVSASLRAAKEANYVLQLPLRLRICPVEPLGTRYILNETIAPNEKNIKPPTKR